MKYFKWTFLLLVLQAATPSSATEIFKCFDSKGKLLFTDNRRLCAETGQAPAASVDAKLRNVHSQYGETVSEEYYNYAFRAYEAVPGRSLRIIAEKKLIDTQPEMLGKAIVKLEKAVATAMAAFPAAVRPEFEGVRYYLFSGEEAHTGGRKGGQWYFRKNNGTSPRFDDSIVVRSAQDYLYNYSDEQAALTAIHELSHAFYYYHRPRLYNTVKEAYDNANTKKLYLNVARKRGKPIGVAYAMTNQREYFAEMSKTYFIGNYHYPFTKLELHKHDVEGFRMVQKAFLFP